MKGDGLLARNFLKGMAGDAINALLCGAGHNLRKILARLQALFYLLPGRAKAALKAFLDWTPTRPSVHPNACLIPQQGFVRADQEGHRGTALITFLEGDVSLQQAHKAI